MLVGFWPVCGDRFFSFVILLAKRYNVAQQLLLVIDARLGRATAEGIHAGARLSGRCADYSFLPLEPMQMNSAENALSMGNIRVCVRACSRGDRTSRS
jgi:hypothetical protein